MQNKYILEQLNIGPFINTFYAFKVYICDFIHEHTYIFTSLFFMYVCTCIPIGFFL